MAGLVSCQARSCWSECGLNCGGVINVDHLPPDCIACVQSEPSCSASETLNGDESLVGLQFCAATCGLWDVTCVDNCVSSHPSTLSDAEVTLAEAPSACADVCPLGGDDWNCLGHIVWPAPTSPMITALFTTHDLQTGAVVPGVTARACSQTDQDCTGTVAAGPTTGDSTGLVTLTMPAAFTGYIELTAPGYVTELYVLYPYRTASNQPPAVPITNLLSEDGLAQFAAALHIAIDPSLGTIAVGPVDCLGRAADKVSFTVGGAGGSELPWYFLDGVPNAQATATQATGSAGGFAHVAPGVVTFSGSVNGSTYATVSIPVRANALTFLFPFVPTQDP